MAGWISLTIHFYLHTRNSFHNPLGNGIARSKIGFRQQRNKFISAITRKKIKVTQVGADG